jgi:hypothetical protein
VFIWALIGGAIAELMKWWRLFNADNVSPQKLEEYKKGPVYWIVTILMVIAGGLLAVAQKIDPANPLLALNVGLSAPLILQGLAAAVPSTAGGGKALSKGEAPTNPINYIAGR